MLHRAYFFAAFGIDKTNAYNDAYDGDGVVATVVLSKQTVYYTLNESFCNIIVFISQCEVQVAILNLLC